MNFQLPLNFNFQIAANFDTFSWGANSQLHDILMTLLNPNTKNQYELPQLHIWGTNGSGKSHLLQASCQAMNFNLSAVYIPLKDICNLDVNMLEGMETQSLIAIDDLEAIANNKEWEEALFHLYNRAKTNNTILIFSSIKPIATIGLSLADLRSRLQAGLTYHLQELSDEEKILTLKNHAQKRGITLSDNVSQFIFNHYSRDMHNLEKILITLDKLSLMHQKKISIPFLLKYLS